MHLHAVVKKFIYAKTAGSVKKFKFSKALGCCKKLIFNKVRGATNIKQGQQLPLIDRSQGSHSSNSIFDLAGDRQSFIKYLGLTVVFM